MKQSSRLDVVVSYTKPLFIVFAICKHLLYRSAALKHCKWSAVCNKSAWAARSVLAAQLGSPRVAPQLLASHRQQTPHRMPELCPAEAKGPQAAPTPGSARLEIAMLLKFILTLPEVITVIYLLWLLVSKARAKSGSEHGQHLAGTVSTQTAAVVSHEQSLSMLKLLT